MDRDPNYRAWLNERTCIACVVLRRSIPLWQRARTPERRMSDAAHTRNNGMRSKGPDSSCVPLCRGHHDEYDAGRAAFEAKYNLDMAQEAKTHYETYRLLRGEA